MGEVKHTPGPWAICADGISVGPDDGFQPFGGCGCCGSPWMTGSHATGTANARLIAAAPDLLEALQNLLGCLYVNDYGDLCLPSGWSDEQARAAISRATGATDE